MTIMDWKETKRGIMLLIPNKHMPLFSTGRFLSDAESVFDLNYFFLSTEAEKGKFKPFLEPKSLPFRRIPESRSYMKNEKTPEVLEPLKISDFPTHLETGFLGYLEASYFEKTEKDDWAEKSAEWAATISNDAGIASWDNDIVGVKLTTSWETVYINYKYAKLLRLAQAQNKASKLLLYNKITYLVELKEEKIVNAICVICPLNFKKS